MGTVGKWRKGEWGLKMRLWQGRKREKRGLASLTGETGELKGMVRNARFVGVTLGRGCGPLGAMGVKEARGR